MSGLRNKFRCVQLRNTKLLRKVRHLLKQVSFSRVGHFFWEGQTENML